MADPRLKPIKCRQTLGEYAARVTWCEACGQPASHGVKISMHHIVKRGRSDERCNLVMLCDWSRQWNVSILSDGRGCYVYSCHERAEAQGRKEQWLPLGVILSIKKLRDPAGWNPERLAQLRLKNLPDLLPIPETLLAEFNRWQHVHSQTEGEVPW